MILGLIQKQCRLQGMIYNVLHLTPWEIYGNTVYLHKQGFRINNKLMQFNRTNTRGSLHQVQRALANRSFCLDHPVSAEQSPFRELPGVYEYNYGNKQISKGLTSVTCLNAIFLRGIPCSIISLVKALTITIHAEKHVFNICCLNYVYHVCVLYAY